MTFSRNPVSNDLIQLKDATAIGRAVRNLIMTHTSERPFQPNLGSRISRLLFEPMTAILADQIKDEIRTTITQFEPRVRLNKVVCIPNYEGNDYEITIRYTVVGIDIPAQELNFVLQPTR